MRPSRLEMSGFAPFKEPTVVDFAGLELFALTGPTGAGKSSVIDAVTFALYGSVPRYGKASVKPVVSLGKAEAKVRLDFEVEAKAYTAVRVVRIDNKGRATTAEARLECGGQVLASGADEVTSAVERLLGLEIGHFTRSVVLPQGQFAAFLHDTPAGQQELVKALLDMGVLDVVRGLATERSRTAKAVIEQARARLDQLADATDEAEQDATRRVADLEKLVDPVESAEAAIAEAQAVVASRQAEATKLEESAHLLGAAEMPAGVARLAESVAELDEKVRRADEQVAAARATIEQIEVEAANVPSATVLANVSQTYQRLEAAIAKRDAIDLTSLEGKVDEARSVLTAAASARDQAASEYDQARGLHAAHALVAGLTRGDPCPVCDQPLPRDPAAPPADLEAKRKAVEAAENRMAEAQDLQRKAEASLTEAKATHAAATETIEELRAGLADAPTAQELPRLMAARQSIDDRLASATSTLEELTSSAQECRAARHAVDEQVEAAWQQFSTLRDRLAVLEPPPAPREDLAGAWEGLVSWAQDQSRILAERLGEAKAAVEDATAAVDKQREELEHMLAEAGIEGSGSASARLAAALATSKADLSRVRERCEERRKLEADVARRSEEEAVASALANHLRANRFEAWVLAEALATLVDGANHLLAELTGGAYSLALDDRRIEVVDHRNADERRPVKSLSGGETFLVSLALALSLGEHLSNLSERGGARLDAIFLDEGFGSLDAETLETVAVVVAELASRGRMVGVVTHVKDLAEQMPNRFEVKVGPTGSTIDGLVA